MYNMWYIYHRNISSVACSIRGQAIAAKVWKRQCEVLKSPTNDVKHNIFQISCDETEFVLASDGLHTVAQTDRRTGRQADRQADR